jgi:predicted membrane chloride channel (bestrophin family)
MRERPERRSPVRHAWTLIERITLRVLNVMTPLLMVVVFSVILFVVLLAFAVLGLTIIGADYAA